MADSAHGLTSVRPPAEAFKHGVLELHNSLRARHGVPCLSWSSECEAHAQLQVPRARYLFPPTLTPTSPYLHLFTLMLTGVMLAGVVLTGVVLTGV